jgi:hypothetical protein
VAYALSLSLAKPDRPMISAAWVSENGGWVLKGSVTASGLKTTDKLTVVVSRLIVTRNQAPPELFTNPGQSTAQPIKPGSNSHTWQGRCTSR